MPTARFQMTEADVIEAARHHRPVAIAENPLYSRTVRIATAIVCGVFVAWLATRLGLWGRHRDEGQFFLYVEIPYVLILQTVFQSTDLVRRVALHRFRGYPLAHAALDIAWDETGIAVNPDGPEPFEWRRFKMWKAADGMMLLYLRAQDYIVLPARALAPGEFDAMRSHLERAGVPQAGASWWRPMLGLKPLPSLARDR